MILQGTVIPIPDNAFWYVVAVAIGGILFYVAKWWISRVESRQDLSDQRFNVFIQQMSEVRETQTLQNQVLEQHSKFIEKEGSSILEMTETMITTLRHLIKNDK